MLSDYGSNLILCTPVQENVNQFRICTVCVYFVHNSVVTKRGVTIIDYLNFCLLSSSQDPLKCLFMYRQKDMGYCSLIMIELDVVLLMKYLDAFYRSLNS